MSANSFRRTELARVNTNSDANRVSSIYPIKQISFTIPWAVIILVAALIISLIVSVRLVSESNNTASEATTTGIMQNISQDDIVFPFSSSRLITPSDLDELYERGDDSRALIQKAINEIYARNGYRFTEQYWLNYYNQFSWYSGTLDMNEARMCFNEIECKNVDFLFSVR